jgi:hypothetical protein
MVSSPVNLAAVTVRAHVERDGGYQSYLGAGTAAGGLSIPDVEAEVGQYLLQVGQEYWLESRRAVPLQVYGETGRADVERGSEGTELRLSLNGLAAWQDQDSIQLTSWQSNCGFWDSSLFRTFDGPISGATSVSAMRAPWQGSAMRLIDTARGDDLVVFQRSMSKTTDGVEYVAASRAAVGPSLTMVAGQATTLAATLSPLAGTSLTVDLRPSAFLAHQAAVHPAATDYGQSFWALARPERVPQGIHLSPELVYAADVPSDGVRTFTYGNPFPTHELYVEASHFFAVSFVFPTDAGDKTYRHVPYSVVRHTAEAGRRLDPVISPPRNVRVAGQGPAELISGSGLTPEITWEPPTMGTVGRYDVLIVRMELLGTIGVGRVAGVVYVDPTTQRLRLPPGILEPGRRYVVDVIARSFTGEPFIDREFAFPFGSATGVSGQIAP